jgi:hypothetical protein
MEAMKLVVGCSILETATDGGGAMGASRVPVSGRDEEDDGGLIVGRRDAEGDAPASCRLETSVVEADSCCECVEEGFLVVKSIVSGTRGVDAVMFGP